MALLDKEKIIKYSQVFEDIRVMNTLLDESEKIINELGMASTKSLESREIFNSVLNALDVKNPKFWTTFQTIATLFQNQPMLTRDRSLCDIRLTSQNKEKYDLIERKMIARFGDNSRFGGEKRLTIPEIIFNSLLILFNEEAKE
jgi:hypothetical protein